MSVSGIISLPAGTRLRAHACGHTGKVTPKADVKAAFTPLAERPRTRKGMALVTGYW